MDAYDKTMQSLGKFVFPIIFGIAGIWLLIKGVSEDPDTQVTQTSWFVYAGLFLFIMAILMGLHIAGVLKKKVGLIMLPVLVALCAWFAFMNYKSVKDRIDQEESYSVYRDNIKQGLLDIRDIQVAFKKKYGRYSDNSGELSQFLMQDKIIYIDDKGDDRVPPDNRMTPDQAIQLGYDPNTAEGEKAMERISEREAVLLGLITRDTVMVPVMEFLFLGRSEAPVLDPVSKPEKRVYPFTSEGAWKKQDGDKAEFVLKATDLGDSTQAQPVFLIMDPSPYDPLNLNDTLKVGSLTKHSTEGTWKD